MSRSSNYDFRIICNNLFIFVLLLLQSLKSHKGLCVISYEYLLIVLIRCVFTNTTSVSENKIF